MQFSLKTIALAFALTSSLARADVDPWAQEYMNDCVERLGRDVPPQVQVGNESWVCNASTNTRHGMPYNYTVQVNDGQFQVNQNVNYNYVGNPSNQQASVDAVNAATKCAEGIFSQNGLSVVFNVTHNSPTGNGVNVNLRDSGDRSNGLNYNILEDMGQVWSDDQRCGMVAHELGHSLQMPDRYEEPSMCPDRATFGPADDLMRSPYRDLSTIDLYGEDIIAALDGVCGPGPAPRKMEGEFCFEGFTWNQETFDCVSNPVTCGPGYEISYSQCTCLGPLQELPDGSCGAGTGCGAGFTPTEEGCACSPPAQVQADGSCVGVSRPTSLSCNLGGDSCSWTCTDGVSEVPADMSVNEDGSCSFAGVPTMPCPNGYDLNTGGCFTPPPSCPDGNQPDAWGTCPSCPFGPDGNGGCAPACPDGSDPTYGCSAPASYNVCVSWDLWTGECTQEEFFSPAPVSPDCSEDGNCIPLNSTYPAPGEGDGSSDLGVISRRDSEGEVSYEPSGDGGPGGNGPGDGSGDGSYTSYTYSGSYTYSYNYSGGPSCASCYTPPGESQSCAGCYTPPDPSSYMPPEPPAYEPPPATDYASCATCSTCASCGWTGGYYWSP